jgi:hypothetical protein
MKFINRHKWTETGWRSYVCSRCKAERYWDKILQRYVYVKFGKSYYMAPQCRMPGDKY